MIQFLFEMAANRDEERQKREDLARGSWTEDLDVIFNYRNIRLTFLINQSILVEIVEDSDIRSNTARQCATQIRYLHFFFPFLVESESVDFSNVK